MTTSTVTQPTRTYQIEYDSYEDGFVVAVLRNDNFIDWLRQENGIRRIFRTRNSARKRVARERSGNFHR